MSIYLYTIEYKKIMKVLIKSFLLLQSLIGYELAL